MSFISLMNEIPNILESREKVEWEGKPKAAPYILKGFFVSLIVGAFIGFFIAAFSAKANSSLATIFGLLGGIVIFLIVFVVEIILFTITHYAITNKRAVIQTGLFGRNFKSVEYDRVQNLSVTRGLIGLIFGVGNVKMFTGEIQSTGGQHSQTRPKYDVFQYILDPYAVMKHLQEHLSERKEKLYSGKA